MDELNVWLLGVSDMELKGGLKAQALALEELLSHLEEQERIGAREYRHCQARLHDVIAQLKRLERLVSEQEAGGV